MHGIKDSFRVPVATKMNEHNTTIESTNKFLYDETNILSMASFFLTCYKFIIVGDSSKAPKPGCTSEHADYRSTASYVGHFLRRYQLLCRRWLICRTGKEPVF